MNEDPGDTHSEEEEAYALFNICSKREAIKVEVTANEKKLVVHIDTGAAVTILCEGTYWALWPQQGPPITPTTTSLKHIIQVNPYKSRAGDATQQGLACTGSEWVWPNPVRPRLDARAPARLAQVFSHQQLT